MHRSISMKPDYIKRFLNSFIETILKKIPYFCIQIVSFCLQVVTQNVYT